MRSLMQFFENMCATVADTNHLRVHEKETRALAVLRAERHPDLRRSYPVIFSAMPK
jgi:hypothetical protein